MSQINENRVYELRGPFQSKLKDMVIVDGGNKNKWGFITFSRKSTYDPKDLDSFTCLENDLININEDNKINIIEMRVPLLGTIRITPKDYRYLSYSKKINEVRKK